MQDDKNYWFTWLVWWLSLIPLSVFRLKEDSGENCDADGNPEENTPREQTALMRNKKISMKEKYITISSYRQEVMILSRIAINVSILFPPYRLFKSYTVVPCLFSGAEEVEQGEEQVEKKERKYKHNPEVLNQRKGMYSSYYQLLKYSLLNVSLLYSWRRRCTRRKSRSGLRRGNPEEEPKKRKKRNPRRGRRGTQEEEPAEEVLEVDPEEEESSEEETRGARRGMRRGLSNKR